MEKNEMKNMTPEELQEYVRTLEKLTLDVKGMTMPELKSFADDLVKDYNDFSQTGKHADAGKINKKIEEVVNQYTFLSKRECFDALKATDDPMLEAVKTLTYTTIAVKDKREGDNKEVVVRSRINVTKPIDLLQLHKYVGGDGIGHNKEWMYSIEYLNYLLTARVCQSLQVPIDPKEINDSYAMSDIARKMVNGENPTSNTRILKALNKVIEDMLGDGYKAISCDVRYLMKIYTRKDSKRALMVICASHSKLRSYVTEICHKIVLNKNYGAEFKTK